MNDSRPEMLITELVRLASSFALLWVKYVELRIGVRRQGAEIFVDCANVLIGHIAEGRPRHDLQQRAILRVGLIQIDACPHDCQKLRIGVTLGQAVRFRSEIP